METEPRYNFAMSHGRFLGYRWHVYMSNHLLLREAGLRQVTCMVGVRQMPVYGHVARFPAKDPPTRTILTESMGLEYDESPAMCFVVASNGVLSKEYGCCGPGVCLGDDQTEAGGVPSESGGSETLLLLMPPPRFIT